MILAAGRRVLLLLLLCVVAFGAWLYWQAPPLDKMRPELEAILKQQLHLEKLHLGHLSWYWAGYTWVQAENVTFADRDGRIRATNTNLALRLSTWSLLAARLKPLSISVRRGAISLHLAARSAAAGFLPLAARISLEDVSLDIHYDGYHGHLDHLYLHADEPGRRLALRFPGSSLDVTWSDAHVPLMLHARFHDLSWLPRPWRKWITGKFAGEITLQRPADGGPWHLQSMLASSKGARLTALAGRLVVPFDTITANGLIHTAGGPLDVSRLEWKTLAWDSGANALHVQGAWTQGKLQLHIRSGRLALPLLTAWARPFGDSVWRHWLNGVHQGNADHIVGDIMVAQTDPLVLPAFSRWKTARIHLQARLHDADVPLPEPGERLRHMEAIAEINDHGASMQVSHVTLPHDAGVVHGHVTIADWRHIIFDIEGGGKVDIGHLQAWRSVGMLPQLRWLDSPAMAKFSLHWPIHADMPEKGNARLMPDPAWQAEWMGQRLRWTEGVLHWNATAGLKIESMRVQHELLAGDLNLSMRLDQQSAWQLTQLTLQAAGDFPRWVKRFHIPLDAPQGRVGARLTFDGTWHLQLDLLDAAWRHLLGVDKAAGIPYVLSMDGEKTPRGINITRVTSRGTMPRIEGSGALQPGQAKVRMDTLRAPAFLGSLNITVPFSDAPVEVSIRSDFMDRTALPNLIPHTIKPLHAAIAVKPEKAWILRGFFRRIQWDAVSIRGVHVRFASSQQGVGSLEAEQLDAAQLSVSHVSSFFRLPGNGIVDLRRLSASLLGQKLTLTATLSPENGGGLRWKGYAGISGDFSEIIHRLDASRLFKGGVLHALWFGQGQIRPGHPWWDGMKGRLRLRADDGRILEGGTMTKLLAALSLTDLPKYLTRKRKDISGPGMLYKRLQVEAAVDGERAHISKLAMRASALDMAGSGNLSLKDGNVDLYMTVRPLQNLDALLRMIPILRDIFLGPAQSLFRLIYHVHGPLYDAKVEAISPEKAGLPESGPVERLIHLPGKWFDAGKKAKPVQP